MWAESAGYIDAVGDWWQSWETYTVQPGDTLTRIARDELKTTVLAIQAANPDLTDPNAIRVGQVLRNPTFVPSSKAAGYGPSVSLVQYRTLHPWALAKATYAPDRLRDIDKLRDPVYALNAAWALSEQGTAMRRWSVHPDSGKEGPDGPDKYRRFKEGFGRDFPLRTGHPQACRWNLDGICR